MSGGAERRSREQLSEESALLREEVHVSRRASEITSQLVVEQFKKMEAIHQTLEDKALIEQGLREQLAQELLIVEAQKGELEASRKAAEAANRTKSTFLANMSHELRTPLNAIIGYSELIAEELDDMGIEGLQDDLDKINRAGKHLLTLINDVLDLSKIEAGKFDIRPENFDIKGAVDDLLTTVKPLVSKNDNTLVVECPADIGDMHGDLVRIRQCLLNLLSNACKFTEAGRIAMTARREAGQIIFRVADSGIGMTAAQMEKLFQPFTQLDDSSTRKYGGTGLGLSITKRFCEMMGGSIDVESIHGEGCTFTIRLPERFEEGPPAPARTAAAPRVAPSEGAVTILTIDDDPSALEWMVRSLGGRGYHVVTADNGEDGLRLARELHPAVIILDVIMPGMDGWSVLESLKADPELSEIPVVVATVFDDRDLGFALGVSDYLTKPIDRNRLVKLLDEYCRDTSLPILIVEDDEVTREALRRTLERERWRVVEAQNGRIGLERLQQDPPALILLDLLMPEMDGFEFVSALRQRDEWRAIPVVVVTAKDLTSLDHKRLDDQVQNVLQKGAYSRAELLSEVGRLLSEKAPRDGR